MSALNAKTMEGFAAGYLSPMYDTPTVAPAFHRKAWELYLKPSRFCAIAAPREHAKSTALTAAFVLAMICFREASFILVLSATERLAADHLSGIKQHLLENADLKHDFGIVRSLSDSTTEVIIAFDDGHQIKVLAKGSEQKLRGTIWKNKRPDLIVGDDLEEDDQVMNPERRRAFRKWFNRALLPVLSVNGRARIHGTILHADSLLAHLMASPSWKSLLFRAHRGFDDFSDILWPGHWTEQRLRETRQVFIDAGDQGGYAQEYLNSPIEAGDAYIKLEWFEPMEGEDFVSPKRIAVGVDLAISKRDHANSSSFTVAGMDAEGVTHVIDQITGRFDATELIETLFAIQELHNPEIFWIEHGHIWLALHSILANEMESRNVWLNIETRVPLRDKAVRGRSLQRRMRAGRMKFDKSAEWFQRYQDVLLGFRAESDAAVDDEFDSSALLSIGLDDWEIEGAEHEAYAEEPLEEFEQESRFGASAVTGY